MAEPPSSPPNPNATTEESLTWYKNQYEQLAVELAEFRESSHELEAELEKDLEAADKRERSLREKAEGARFEAEEWKVNDTRFESGIMFIDGATGKMQKGQDRSQWGAKCPGKGDYYSPRHKQDTSTKTARYRGRQ